jgi:hypothetical protein
MLILRGVMDPEWLARAHEAIDFITSAAAHGEDAPAYTETSDWRSRTTSFSLG